jgi:hypothetical protein
MIIISSSYPMRKTSYAVFVLGLHELSFKEDVADKTEAEKKHDDKDSFT